MNFEKFGRKVIVLIVSISGTKGIILASDCILPIFVSLRLSDEKIAEGYKNYQINTFGITPLSNQQFLLIFCGTICIITP
jgi:hypothetical protein